MTKKLRLRAAAAAFAAASAGMTLTAASTASAAALRFDGFDNGRGYDTPQGGNAVSCNSTGANGSDLCSLDDAAGFTFVSGDLIVLAQGLQNAAPGVGGTAAEIVQTLVQPNQGLGVLSDDEIANSQWMARDQVNFNQGEAIRFSFSRQVTISDIFLNDGNGSDCLSNGGGVGPAGPCGGVRITTDTGLDVTWNTFLNGVLQNGSGAAASVTGSVITFYGAIAGALNGTDDFGYVIEQFTVAPVPGAMPLLISGIVGLGFAARRRKTAV